MELGSQKGKGAYLFWEIRYTPSYPGPARDNPLPDHFTGSDLQRGYRINQLRRVGHNTQILTLFAELALLVLPDLGSLLPARAIHLPGSTTSTKEVTPQVGKFTAS